MNRKHYCRLAIVMLFSLLIIFPTKAQQNNVSKSRAVWMWGSTISSGNHQTIVNKLSDNHVNEVFLLVKGIAGTRTPAETLRNFINLVHDKNIKIHLWLVIGQDEVFYYSNRNSSVYHNPNPKLVVASNPETQKYMNPYSMNDERINFLYPGYKEYVLDHIKYFLNNFNCDGIHLDYIRYAHLVYSFDQQHLERAASIGCDTAKILNMFRDNYAYYATNSGWISVYKTGDPDVVKWVEMRSQIVYEYIEAIKDTIEKYKPYVELTASFMPEGATGPSDAEPHYSQNYALNSPLLSRIFPMAYFLSYGNSPSWTQTVTTRAINLVSQNCKIVTGVQAFNGVTPDQMSSQINLCLQAGSHGIVIFKYEDITEAQWAVIKPLFDGLSDVENILSPPTEFNLEQNYPNPFNPTTNIKFSLEKSGITKLTIYDIMGREIETLINDHLSTGVHEIVFNASNYSSGVYYYKLQSNNLMQVKKMILIK
jgi:uncharacterized lipoprotein YddW (UPF0748 family)